MSRAADEVAGLRRELDAAADALLDAATEGLSHLPAAKRGSTEAFEAVQSALRAIVQACAFHDLAGQRLSRLAGLLSEFSPEASKVADPLLNGPADPGQGLDQAAADALFAETAGPV